jgi:hypothetical protein
MGGGKEVFVFVCIQTVVQPGDAGGLEFGGERGIVD